MVGGKQNGSIGGVCVRVTTWKNACQRLIAVKQRIQKRRERELKKIRTEIAAAAHTPKNTDRSIDSFMLYETKTKQ